MKFTVDVLVKFFMYVYERHGEQIGKAVTYALQKGLDWAVSMAKEWAQNKIDSLVSKLRDFIRSFASAAFA